MRDHTRLRAFELADGLAVALYRETRRFPADERFGLVSQIRRAAVSVPSNIVEGCARESRADLVHFLQMAYGSAREVEYQLSLAHRLGFLAPDRYAAVRRNAEESCKVLHGLIRSLRR